MAQSREEFIDSRHTYRLDSKILETKKAVDGVVELLRHRGGVFEDDSKTKLKSGENAIEALTLMFKYLSEEIGEKNFPHYPHYSNLFELCFGGGTRFDDWLREQKVGASENLRGQIDAIKAAIKPQEIQLSSHLQGIIQNDEDRPIAESLNQIILDYKDLTHSISVINLFLERIINSRNVDGKYKPEIVKFLTELNSLRDKLQSLNFEEILKNKGSIEDVVTALETFYKDHNYKSTMQFLWDLRDQFNMQFKPLIEQVLEDSPKFNFHLGTESPNNFLNFLDRPLDAVLSHPQRFKEPQALASLNAIHEQYEQVHQGQLYAKNLIWAATQGVKPADIPKTIRQTCFKLLFDMDAEINTDNPIVKENQNYRAGYLEQLLIYLEPELFSRNLHSPFGSKCAPIFLGQENKFGATNNEQFSGKNLSDSGESSAWKVLAAISPIQESKGHLAGFTIQQKLETYLALMKAIDTGALSLSNDSPLEQKRMIAERVMHYMQKYHLPKAGNETIEEIESLIQSSAAEKAAKKISGFFADKSGKPKTIQKQFREYIPAALKIEEIQHFPEAGTRYQK